MANTFDKYLRRAMLPMVTEVYDKAPKSFLLDFFTNIYTSDTEKVDQDIVKGGRRTAMYVSPLEAGQVVERNGFGTNTYAPPTLKPKMKVTYEDLLKRMPGEVLYANSMSPVQRATALMAMDMLELETLIRRAEAVQAAQALVTDTILFKNVDGVAVNTAVSYGRPTANSISSAFSNDAINPMDVLEAAQVIIEDATGLIGWDAVFGKTAWAYFRDNANITDRFKNILQNPADKLAAQYSQETGAKYRGELDGFILNTFNDKYGDMLNPDSSNEPTLTPMIPDNVCLLIARGARFTKAYGAIKHDEATAAMARFPVSYRNDDPAIRWLQLYSSPLMVVNQPDAVVKITVS